MKRKGGKLVLSFINPENDARRGIPSRRGEK
jgi:hypothetical protein